MLQSAPPTSLGIGDPADKAISPPLPYVFAFALRDAPILPEPISSGEVVEIAVRHDLRSASAGHDWFAARVPEIPAATGPLAVGGIQPGDRIEVEVLTIEAEDPVISGPLRATLEIAGSSWGRGDGPVQVIVPASSAVRLKARRIGGLLSIGPVTARHPEETDVRAVAARVTVRCTVLPSIER